MFTGLIKSIGTVKQVNQNASGVEITVYDPTIAQDVSIDDSVSINGACQTVISFTENTFTVQAVSTTLEKTNFSTMKVGTYVNLELALRLSDRLGGHIVQGHVNGVGTIEGWQKIGMNYELNFNVPKELLKYIVKEGSITLNGVSLTISELNYDKRLAQVSIIPHTWENTIFKFSRPQDSINIEVDVLAKYIENLIFRKQEEGSTQSKITEDWLRSQGF